MTVDEFKEADIGDTFTFTPDVDNLGSFEHSVIYERMEKCNAKSFELTFVENRHGFVNSFSFELRLVKENGDYVNDAEWLEYDLDEMTDLDDREIRDLKRVFVETDEDTNFLNYLTNYIEWLN